MDSSSDNPFIDPTAEAASAESDSANDLYVERNARLTLTEDALIVYGPSTTQAIPYRNVLDATVTDFEVSIIHALPTSKRAVRPAYITYSIQDKTATSHSKEWVKRLLALAYAKSQRFKRIKVIVNPYGGKGLAPKIYAKDAEPIFKAAKCEVDVVTTMHAGHAVEIGRDLDVDRYDVVVCCSGDGTPHELFNGLSQQERPRRALRKIAVAQIPAGSGNALSLNCNGTDSPSLAALAIVKGTRVPFDLVSISQGEKRYLSFLSQSVGIVAESDLGTDNIRWMGSARFTFGFLVRLLGKTVYPAEVSVKVEIEDKDSIRQAYKKSRYDRDETDEGADQSRELHDSEPLPVAKHGTVHDPIPADWETTDMPTLGNFFCGNMCYMSPDSPFFAAALPSDGLMDLVEIDGTIPRHTSVKLMFSIENNGFFDQPQVSYRKISAYRITPQLRPDQKEGLIAIDGEKVDFAPFQAEMVPGVATVLSSSGQAYNFDGPPEKKESR